MITEPHPFSHLGPGPYRYGGMGIMPGQDILEKNPMAYNAAMAQLAAELRIREGLGSCAHCGRPIKFIYVVECADSSRWGVGCSCIERLSYHKDRGLVSKVKQAKAKQAKKKRLEAVSSGESWITDNLDALRLINHPTRNGLTMVDYLNWIWANAGTAGKTRAIKTAKKALEETS